MTTSLLLQRLMRLRAFLMPFRSISTDVFLSLILVTDKLLDRFPLVALMEMLHSVGSFLFDRSPLLH